MVSSEKVWSYVENMRKEQRPFRRLLQRCRQWFHSSNDDSSDRSTNDADSSPSLTDDDEEITNDVEQGAGHGSAETSPGHRSRASSSDKDSIASS
jgi:hypothetical protein